MSSELTVRQAERATVVRFFVGVFMTTFAMFGLLSLVGAIPSTGMKLWVSACVGISVHLALLLRERHQNRKT